MSNCSNVSFKRARLIKANLRGAILTGADMSEADLSLADLSFAELSRVNFRLVDMRGTIVSEKWRSIIGRFRVLNEKQIVWVE